LSSLALDAGRLARQRHAGWVKWRVQRIVRGQAPKANVLPRIALDETCLARAPKSTLWKLRIARLDALAKAAVTICLTRLDQSDVSADYATLTILAELLS
jgi:hypothetical protein